MAIWCSLDCVGRKVHTVNTDRGFGLGLEVEDAVFWPDAKKG